MDKKIHEELLELQEELARLRSAVDHIDDAKQLAVKVAESGDGLMEKYEHQIEVFRRIIDAYENQKEGVATLIEQVKAVDFPKRFSELSGEIHSATSDLQMVRGNIDKLGNELGVTLSSLNSRYDGLNKSFEKIGFEKKFESLKGLIIDADSKLNSIASDAGKTEDKTKTLLVKLQAELEKKIADVTSAVVKTEGNTKTLLEKLQNELEKKINDEGAEINSKLDAMIANVDEKQKIINAALGRIQILVGVVLVAMVVLIVMQFV